MLPNIHTENCNFQKYFVDKEDVFQIVLKLFDLSGFVLFFLTL